MDSSEVSIGERITLHMDYTHYFAEEFRLLLKQKTFADIIFREDVHVLKNKDAPYYRSLLNLFECSFNGLALGLSRVWDERKGDLSLISIPNLVHNFPNNKFLGCLKLRTGETDRLAYDALSIDPIRMRLRVIRTESLAHSVQTGASRDRAKSDIQGVFSFNLINGDVLDFCQATLELLFSLNDQLSIAKWRNGKTMAELTQRYHDQHIALLRHLDPSIQ